MENIALYKMQKISYRLKDVQLAIDEAFRLMGYDAEHMNDDDWNPLGDIIHPGDNVLLKPNMVMHKNYNPNGGLECLFTQKSVVEAVLKYVVRALKNDKNGKITIADAPMQACDFEQLIEKSGYREMVERYQQQYPKIKFEIKDLRGVKSFKRNGVCYYTEKQNAEQVVVRLNGESEFAKLPQERIASMRITDYDPDIMRKHHNGKCHEYAIAKDILEADVIINMPKPKTHRKAGITCSLKNIVGICTRKEYLPHHTIGEYTEETSAKGGDEYKTRTVFRRIEDNLLDWKNRFAQTYNRPMLALVLHQFVRINHLLSRCLCNEKIYEGNWYGNRTISKTITDLNKILFYASRNGDMLQGRRCRKYLIVADMIILGDGEGPLAPSSYPLGVVGVGENPVAFDEIVATLFGAKMEYMNTIKQARLTSKGKYPLIDESVKGCIKSNCHFWDGKFWDQIDKDDKLDINPTSGWREAFYR
ncbi:MAG: DUF362 domain-containing protein [Butyrivibrio sp.]|nr:DUF362 domain-containing protein [Butyrivibrio sp.]